MGNRKILITGASGYIANKLLPILLTKYETTLLDSTSEDPNSQPVPGVKIVDLSDPDSLKYSGYFKGVDTVLHLAYQRGEKDTPDQFFYENMNIEMTYNVLRCAYEAGVKRVAYASSHHASNWYDHSLIQKRKLDMLTPYSIPLSNSFYGWSKAACEHLGFLFSCGSFGRKMGVVNIRIGAPHELELSKFDNNPSLFKRSLGLYISTRDLNQIFVRSIEAENILNEHDVPWHIVYGISDNTRSYLSLANARSVLGYAPEDDSEITYANEIRQLLTGEDSTASPGKIG